MTELSKALAFHARSLEIYEQMDLAQPAIERGALIHKLNLMSEGKLRAELDLTGIGTDMSPYPYVLTFEQSENEKLLYEFLQKNGKEVWWQTELEALRRMRTASGRQLNRLRPRTGDRGQIPGRMRRRGQHHAAFTWTGIRGQHHFADVLCRRRGYGSGPEPGHALCDLRRGRVRAVFPAARRKALAVGRQYAGSR